MARVFAQPSRVERSFERLYRRHAGDVYRYAYAVLQNRSDAEDVTQTTFLNAYRALERGERPERAHNWLIAIAHNVCRQRFRQSQRRPSEVAWNDEVAEALVADDPAPTGEDIRRALSYLPFNQRAAIVMRELEGRSYSEIADVLELSASAVETLIFRARRALREQLEGSLTCGEAELAISKQLDGRLSRAEKGQLRAHLRECAECATFARRQRAQRSALKSLGAIPLPPSLAALFGGGGGATATAVAGKAVALVAAAAFAGGAGYEAARHVEASAAPTHAAVSVPASLAVPAAQLPAQAVVRSRRAAARKARGHDAAGASAPGIGHTLKRLHSSAAAVAAKTHAATRHRHHLGARVRPAAGGSGGVGRGARHARGHGGSTPRRSDAAASGTHTPPSHSAHSGASAPAPPPPPQPSEPSRPSAPPTPAEPVATPALPVVSVPALPVTVPALPQPRGRPGHRNQGASFLP